MKRTERRPWMARLVPAPARVFAASILLLVLVCAPALDLVGDGLAARSPISNTHVLDLCSIPGLAPTSLSVSPPLAIGRPGEAAVPRAPWLPTRPAEHPPRAA